MGMNMDWAFWDGNTISCGRQIWVFYDSDRVFEALFLFFLVFCQAYPFSASFLLSHLGGNYLPWCARFRYHGRKEGL